MMHIFSGEKKKKRKDKGYSQECVAGILVDSKLFTSRASSWYTVLLPEPHTLNSSIFFSSNIPAAAYDFSNKKPQHDRNTFISEYRVLPQSAWISEVQNSILLHKKFIIRFITHSNWTGTIGSGTLQVSFFVLFGDVLKNVFIALLEERWCQQKFSPGSTGLSRLQKGDLSISPVIEKESFVFASSTSGRGDQNALSCHFSLF